MPMCEQHNKQALRHLLELEMCDGFCLSLDPCEQLTTAVKNCDQCSDKAMVECTTKYKWDGELWVDEDEEEVLYETVENYSTN